MGELARIPDNSGDRFKQLVRDICRLEAIADELLDPEGDPELQRKRLERYLQKGGDPDQAIEWFRQIVAATDFSSIRELANLMDPDQMIFEEADAPI